MRRTGVIFRRRRTHIHRGQVGAAGLGGHERWSASVIEQFINHQHACGWTEQTIHRRKLTLGQFARFVAPLELAAVQLSHIEAFLNTKENRATRHAYRSDLRVFYDWAVDHELVAKSPAAKVHRVKVPKTMPRPIPSDDVMVALETGSFRVRRMIALGLYAGLRAGEIARLDWSDINLERRTIDVRQGKGMKDRTVRLHPVLREMFADGGTGPVFTHAGRQIKAASVSRAIRRHFAELGINATAHMLRHTFGTEAARAARGDVVKLKTAMGHASATTTFGYIGLTGDETAFIDDMFDGGTPPAAA